MKKISLFIIESISWLQVFLCPVFIGGLAALLIYIANHKLLWLSMVVLATAVVTGFLFAQKVRKKYGASRFLAKRLATPDIWPDEYPEEIEAREKEEELEKVKGVK